MKISHGIKKIFWIIIVITIFALQFVCKEHLGDDIFFSAALDDRCLGDFLKMRYRTWTSRIVIETILVYVAKWNPFIWRIGNAIMIIILICAVSKAFGQGEETENRIIFSCLLPFIPIASLKSAGWITTTVNYLWVLALGLVVIVSLRRIVEGQLRFPGFFISLPALIYAANMEQMAAILLGAYLVTGVYMASAKKPIPWMYFIQFFIVILSLCFILFSPGNMRRTMVETEKYFPIFDQLTVFEKLSMGFLVTLRYYVGNDGGRPIFLILCATLLLCMIARKIKGIFQWAVAIFPLLSIALLAFMKILFRAGLWQKGARVLEVIWNNNSIAAASIFKEEYIRLQILYYMVVLLCILMTIYWIHGRTRETLLELTLLLGGLLSRILMGFSPTIYASGDRTALFASIALLIIVMRNVQRNLICF